MHAPSATQISKSTETNSPHTPIIPFSVPTRPQVLISWPVSASNDGDCFIFDLYSISIGPGFAPSGISIFASSISSIASSSDATFGFGFALRTIIASGVNSSNLLIDSFSEIFSSFISAARNFSSSIVLRKIVSVTIFAK